MLISACLSYFFVYSHFTRVTTDVTSHFPVLKVWAGHPHNGQGRGEHVLNCMTAVVPNLHDDLVDLWDAVVPKLLSYLSGTANDIS